MQHLGSLWFSFLAICEMILFAIVAHYVQPTWFVVLLIILTNLTGYIILAKKEDRND